MCGPVRGEADSPVGGTLECAGLCRCENPIRVTPCGRRASARRSDGDRRRPIDTLGRRLRWRAIAGAAKRVRGGREKSWPRSSREYPRRAKPKGGSSVWRANPSLGARDFRKAATQEPRPLGPVRRFGGGSTAGRNGKWVRSGGNASGTFREEKPPKGESQERCRYETRPARDRRE
jgi:hypothetical protein